MKRLRFVGTNLHKIQFIISCVLKLIISIGLGIYLRASSAQPTIVSAQGEVIPFPGRLTAEGIWGSINPNYELIYLGNNRLLSRETSSNQYRIWQYSPTPVGEINKFPGELITEGVLSISPGHRLTHLGGSQILDWDPRTGQYKIQQYNLDTTRNTNLLSTQSIAEGTLAKTNFERKLIYIESDRVLDWEPETGRYQFWRYDPTIAIKQDSFPGELIAEGIWSTIRTGHELVYLGYRRMLDWEPETGHYRIWRYDPMVTGNGNPLVGKPVAEGTWQTMRTGHQLISLDKNHLLDWEPKTNQYHIWQFELMSIGAFSVNDIGKKLEGQTITGVTGITHGFQLFDSGGGALMALARDIHNRAGGWLLDYDIDGEGNDFFDSCTNDCGNPAPGQKGTHEVVLLFDWAPGSNEISSGWGEAAGDALFNILIATTLVNPTAVDNPPYHFIGHSFGAAVTSEVVERLAYFGIPVDHVTFLDPHDFDQGLKYDTAQRLFDLGKPPGYGIAVWNNVVFADVYYQTRGEPVNIITPIPNGRPIPGSYNRFLLKELPSQYPLLSTDNDHTYVWYCFYRATVTGTLPADCLLPAVSPVYTQTGYVFSRMEQPDKRPLSNFYASQSHVYSNPKIVDRVSGQPNLTGLKELGLNADQIVQGRWESDWIPNAVVNSKFEHYNLKPACYSILTVENPCPQSGWSYHGGGGDGHFERINNNNTYLELDWQNTIHTHNRLYVPPNSTELQFDLRRTSGPGSPLQPPSDRTDTFEVYISDQVVASYLLTDFNEDQSFIRQYISLPQSFLGKVTTMTFGFSTSIDLRDWTEVWIDNVKLIGPPQDIQVLTGVTDIPDNSGQVDFGETTVGVPLNKIFIIKNAGSLDLVLTEPITVPVGFNVIQSFGNSIIDAGQSTTFSVQLDATTTGIYSGTLAFANDDSDETPFNFELKGTVVNPEKAIYLPVILR